MNLIINCDIKPVLLLFTFVVPVICYLNIYVLIQYCRSTCIYSHDLFSQSIVSVICSLASGCVVFYITIMPEKGNINYTNGIVKFAIGYILLSIIVFVNTFIFFDSEIYLFRIGDCNKFYYYVTYINTLLGCIPHYLITLYLFVCWIKNIYGGIRDSNPVTYSLMHDDLPKYVKIDNIQNIKFQQIYENSNSVL